MTSPGGTIRIADRTVSRLGLGTMRLTGPGTWGHPADTDTAACVLREAVHNHGITHIDTADAYGLHTVEELIRHALHPYPAELLLATKVGMVRPSPNMWRPLGRPEYLRAAVEASLRRLEVEQLSLCYLHRIDPAISLADQVGELHTMREEGKIAHIGLSKVDIEQVKTASTITGIAAVQNCLNAEEPDDPVLHHCQAAGIPYIPYRPLNAGVLATAGPRKALEWLHSLGGHVAPIPGTTSPLHLRELAAAMKTLQ